MIAELRHILCDPASTPASTQKTSADSQNIPPHQHHQQVAATRALEQVLLFDADNPQSTNTTITTSCPTAADDLEMVAPGDDEDLLNVSELSKHELDEELSLATNAAKQVRRKVIQNTANDEEGTLEAEKEEDEEKEVDKNADENDGDLFSLGEDNDFIVVSTEDDEYQQQQCNGCSGNFYSFWHVLVAEQSLLNVCIHPAPVWNPSRVQRRLRCQMGMLV